jgi:hypothetical protein
MVLVPFIALENYLLGDHKRRPFSPAGIAGFPCRAPPMRRSR